MSNTAIPRYTGTAQNFQTYTQLGKINKNVWTGLKREIYLVFSYKELSTVFEGK